MEQAKNERLKLVRGASFEEIIASELIAVKHHPKREDQDILLFKHKSYIWIVPYVEDTDYIFLKTLYPSRKIHKTLPQRRFKMRKIRLTRQEQAIENSLLEGEYVNVSKDELEMIAQAIANRKKDAVLNIRVNSQDLRNIKQKAERLGLRYQTFISEILHRIAQ